MHKVMTILKKQTGQGEASATANEKSSSSNRIPVGFIQSWEKEDGAEEVEDTNETSGSIDAEGRCVVE
jgi:hypothetical protein